ncbi:hypothetical protein [Micrococcoides hystricis]|uniref:DNA-directed RNA polymerase subunit beta n=1 Tax=Micrococcoides hystricis TaxID=1572761 RepID=A0ABV6PD94_9MICC
MTFSSRAVAQQVPFRHHKPKPMEPVDFAAVIGGEDPAEITEAAHVSAQLLVESSQSAEEQEVKDRILALAQEHGIELLAQMWASAPPVSLPGALWRLYVLHTALTRQPAELARYFREGKPYADVSAVVAGVIEPPGAKEITTVSHEILSGLFQQDLDVALDRAAAFCVVVSAGQQAVADRQEHDDPSAATSLYEQSHRLRKTAQELASAARAWRQGALD